MISKSFQCTPFVYTVYGKGKDAKNRKELSEINNTSFNYAPRPRSVLIVPLDENKYTLVTVGYTVGTAYRNRQMPIEMWDIPVESIIPYCFKAEAEKGGWKVYGAIKK